MATPTTPVIGLTTYRETAAWGVWQQRADLLPTLYAVAVEAVGGAPVLLPPSRTDVAAAVVARLDALIVSGGGDVDPDRYAEPPHPRTAGVRAERDAWELALVAAAEAAGLPVLGVCRGMQVMAVAAGGTLDQHLPDRLGHATHGPTDDTYGDTAVTTVAGTRVAGLVGDRLAVSCHHHQAVATHPGYTAAAYSGDGVLEAMESPGEVFRVAVQWHPETADDIGLLAGLVRAAGG